MDQRNIGGIGPFGGQDLGGGGIDDPGVAQPSLGRTDDPEAGTGGAGLGSGSLDPGGDLPTEGREDVPGGVGADDGGLGDGTENLDEGNVGGFMGGPRLAGEGGAG